MKKSEICLAIVVLSPVFNSYRKKKASNSVSDQCYGVQPLCYYCSAIVNSMFLIKMLRVSPENTPLESLHSGFKDILCANIAFDNIFDPISSNFRKKRETDDWCWFPQGFIKAWVRKRAIPAHSVYWLYHQTMVVTTRIFSEIDL